jgi:hypothetical protein
VLTTVRRGYSPLMGSEAILRHNGPKSKGVDDSLPPQRSWGGVREADGGVIGSGTYAHDPIVAV